MLFYYKHVVIACSILLRFATICNFGHFTKLLKPLQNREKQNNDKSTIHVPQHSSFMIMHTFADLGNMGQNMVESMKILWFRLLRHRVEICKIYEGNENVKINLHDCKKLQKDEGLLDDKNKMGI